jgi:hypothetical protein
MIAENVEGMEFADPQMQKPHPENPRVAPPDKSKNRALKTACLLADSC